MHIHTTPSRPRLGALIALGAIGIAAAALLGPASPAQAHDQLVDTVVETTDGGATSGVRMSFSDNVLSMGTEVMVTNAAGDDVTTGEAEIDGPNVSQAVTSTLPDGTYTTVWRVVSSDGHPIEGGFSFDIADGTPGEVQALPSAALQSDDSQPENETEKGSSGATNGSNLAIPLSIGAVVLVVVAVAIPTLMRMRKPENESDHKPDHKPEPSGE